MNDYENYKSKFSWITTDKPRKLNEPRNNPMLFNATGKVVFVDYKYRAHGFGRIRIKFDQPVFGIRICEFPCYDKNLVIKRFEDGSILSGLYIIEKIK